MCSQSQNDTTLPDNDRAVAEINDAIDEMSREGSVKLLCGEIYGSDEVGEAADGLASADMDIEIKEREKTVKYIRRKAALRPR